MNKTKQRMNNGENNQQFDPASYLAGRLERDIEIFLAGSEILLPKEQVTQRVAGILLATTGWPSMGAENRMPPLPRQATKEAQRSSPLALASGTRTGMSTEEQDDRQIRRRRKMSAETKKKISEGGKARWAKQKEAASKKWKDMSPARRKAIKANLAKAQAARRKTKVDSRGRELTMHRYRAMAANLVKARAAQAKKRAEAKKYVTNKKGLGKAA